MKKILLILLILLLSAFLNAEEKIDCKNIDSLNYVFPYKNLYIRFENNKVYYNLLRESGMGETRICGYGKYKINYSRNEIIIKNRKHPIEKIYTKSFYIERRNPELNKGVFQFEIYDKYKKPIKFASCYLTNIHKAPNFKRITDNKIQININNIDIPNDSFIRIGKIGYNDLFINIKDKEKGSYVVFLEAQLFHILEKGKTIIKFNKKTTDYTNYSSDYLEVNIKDFNTKNNLFPRIKE